MVVGVWRGLPREDRWLGRAVAAALRQTRRGSQAWWRAAESMIDRAGAKWSSRAFVHLLHVARQSSQWVRSHAARLRGAGCYGRDVLVLLERQRSLNDFRAKRLIVRLPKALHEDGMLSPNGTLSAALCS